LPATYTALHYGLVTLEGSDIVLDRMYIHGQPNSQLARCVSIHGARQQVADSWLSECHATGQDAQAIWGANGAGPYRIVNNYLEASGENVMFGGADPPAGIVPSDIEIRGNHFYKPQAWRASGQWTVKNLLEFKNAVRVLIEGNVFDGSWLHGQTGWAVVVKSANQSGGCRWCRSTDLVFRRNLYRNVSGGINIAARGDNVNTDTTARRIAIVEDVFDGIGNMPGDKRGLQILAGVQSVTVERTVISGPLIVALFLDKAPGATGVRLQSNFWARGQYGVLATGAAPGAASLNVGAPGWVWQSMTMIGSSNGTYPPGTTWVTSEPAGAAAIRAIVASATNGVVVQP
jgi:hypothetical protein